MGENIAIAHENPVAGDSFNELLREMYPGADFVCGVNAYEQLQNWLSKEDEPNIRALFTGYTLVCSHSVAADLIYPVSDRARRSAR